MIDFDLARFPDPLAASIVVRGTLPNSIKKFLAPSCFFEPWRFFFACRLLKKARVRTRAEQKRRLDHQVQFFRSFQFFYFVFVYQLCELFILLINLICQIAYFVISFIATVCDSRQFSGNSDVTMKLIKTRRNLVMVKKGQRIKSDIKWWI